MSVLCIYGQLFRIFYGKSLGRLRPAFPTGGGDADRIDMKIPVYRPLIIALSRDRHIGQILCKTVIPLFARRASAACLLNGIRIRIIMILYGIVLTLFQQYDIRAGLIRRIYLNRRFDRAAGIRLIFDLLHLQFRKLHACFDGRYKPARIQGHISLYGVRIKIPFFSTKAVFIPSQKTVSLRLRPDRLFDPSPLTRNYRRRDCRAMARHIKSDCINDPFVHTF